VYDGNPLNTRVELKSIGDDGAESVHDVPVEAFGLMADCDGCKLVLVVGALCFEVQASARVDDQKLDELLDAAKHWRSRVTVTRSKDEMIESMRADVERQERELAATRSKLHATVRERMRERESEGRKT
jgi:hypothetical protein